MKVRFNYELELFDELISETLHPEKLADKSTSVTIHQVNGWLGKASTEKNKIRKQLKLVTYSFLKEKHKRLYIQQHQSAIIRLLDTLFNYINPKNSGKVSTQRLNTSVEKLYKLLFTYCQELLHYIRNTFPEYFNNDFKVPDYELKQVQQQWKTRLASIRKRLLRISSDKQLVEILFSVLNTVADEVSNNNLSYRTVNYINQLLTGLENLQKQKKLNGQYSSLIALLMYWNFNDTRFKNYLVEIICIDVNLLKTVKEKIDKLSFHLKEIGQMHSKSVFSFHVDMPSVKEDMKDWLSREIKYLKKSENLGIIVPARFSDSPQYKRGIWFTYTIEELALLHRVQHDAGYITNTNIIAMMEDLSKIAHTATQHNISFKNLKNLFYNIDLNTIDSMHDKLLLMIRKLQNLKAEVIKKEKNKSSLRKSK